MAKISELLVCTDEEMRLIQKKFGVTGKQIKESVDILKKWIQQSPNVPNEIIKEDKYLERFLLFGKFSIERTKKIIEASFYARCKHTNIFKEAYPSNDSIQLVNEIIYCTPLPKLTSKQERISIFKIRDENLLSSHKDKSICFMAYVYLIMQMRLLYDYQTTNVIVVDFQGITMTALAELWNNGLELVQLLKSFIRISQIHIINPPMFISFALNLVATINPELLKRLVVHANIKTLEDYIPKDLLPPELNGNVGFSLEQLNVAWMKELECNESFFRKLEDYTKTIDCTKLEYSNTELEGTFRQLEVD